MNDKQVKLVEEIKHQKGEFGGFSFGGQQPDGVNAHNPLPQAMIFPNGAKAAILLTFDVEGNFGNGAGDELKEVSNYKKISDCLSKNKLRATFNVLGEMVERHGSNFVEWMLEAGCEVASHGYWHNLNIHYGGNLIYAGHYGFSENFEQILRSIEVLAPIIGSRPKGIRMPYGHFNEFTYAAMEELDLIWASNVGIDENSYGSSPFQMQLGEQIYDLVEIPLDNQTFDWAILEADVFSNASTVKQVQNYCHIKKFPFSRNVDCAINIWKQRINDTIEKQTVFTLLCHPINLVTDEKERVNDFLFSIIDYLSKLQNENKLWICTCSEMACFAKKIKN